MTRPLLSKRAERLNAVRTYCETVVNSRIALPRGPLDPDGVGTVPHQMGMKKAAQRVLDLLDGRARR